VSGPPGVEEPTEELLLSGDGGRVEPSAFERFGKLFGFLGHLGGAIAADVFAQLVELGRDLALLTRERASRRLHLSRHLLLTHPRQQALGLRVDGALLLRHVLKLLQHLGEKLADVPNRIKLEGHTDAQPFVSGDRGYSNWELSSDRGNASRRELVAGGLPEDRMLLVQGLASSLLFDANDPLSAANRRISIIVMNREAEDRLLRATPEVAEPEAAPAVETPARPSIVPPSPVATPR